MRSYVLNTDMGHCILESQFDASIHTILSGPYDTEGECLGGCDSSSSSSTSSSSSSSSGPCGLSSGSIQPPVVSSGTFFNLNDFEVIAFIQQSVDGGSTWLDFTQVTIDPNSSYNTGVGALFRARCASTGSGDSLSAWSS